MDRQIALTRKILLINLPWHVYVVVIESFPLAYGDKLKNLSKVE